MEMSIENLTVTHIAVGGMGFGKTDDGTMTYIPKRLVQHAKIAEFGQYTATLIPNPYMPEKTPLMAVSIKGPQVEDDDDNQVLEDIEPPQEVKAKVNLGRIAAKAVEHLTQNPAAVLTAPELAEIVGGANWRHEYGQKLATYIVQYLQRAHERGDVARADVYRTADQERPTIYRWSADWRNL